MFNRFYASGRNNNNNNNNTNSNNNNNPIYIAPCAEHQRRWAESQLGWIKTVIKKETSLRVI